MAQLKTDLLDLFNSTENLKALMDAIISDRITRGHKTLKLLTKMLASQLGNPQLVSEKGAKSQPLLFMIVKSPNPTRCNTFFSLSSWVNLYPGRHSCNGSRNC